MKIALIISLIILAIGLVSFVYRYAAIEASSVCWGRVIELPESSNSDGTTYIIVAEFRDNNGTKHQYRSSWSSSNPGYNVGDEIRLYYDPSNPGNNGIMTFMGAYGLPFVFMTTSFVCGIIFLASIYSIEIMDYVHKSKFLNKESKFPVEGF